MNRLRCGITHKKGVIQKVLAAAAISLAGAFSASAGDKVALKTNLLYDALLSPTVGIEVGMAPQWSFDLSATINAWTVNDHRWKQWMVQPEARYWFCQRSSGHFLAAHAIGGQYNFGNLKNDIKFLGTDFSQLTDRRMQGWMVGAGIGYGYSWILSRHWNIEAELGIGYIYTNSDVYSCFNCGRLIKSNDPHNYFGLTKVAVNMIYTF